MKAFISQSFIPSLYKPQVTTELPSVSMYLTYIKIPLMSDLVLHINPKHHFYIKPQEMTASKQVAI